MKNQHPPKHLAPKRANAGLITAVTVITTILVGSGTATLTKTLGVDGDEKTAIITVAMLLASSVGTAYFLYTISRPSEPEKFAPPSVEGRYVPKTTIERKHPYVCAVAYLILIAPFAALFSIVCVTLPNSVIEKYGMEPILTRGVCFVVFVILAIGFWGIVGWIVSREGQKRDT